MFSKSKGASVEILSRVFTGAPPRLKNIYNAVFNFENICNTNLIRVYKLFPTISRDMKTCTMHIYINCDASLSILKTVVQLPVL